MSYSYMTSDSPNDRDFVRFRINDIAVDSGPKPGGDNFSNEELDMIITEEGSWRRAVAACYETLSAAWAEHTSWTADGMSISQSATMQKYDDLAIRWRRMHGGLATAHSRSVIRVDGYSQDTPVDEVT